MELVKFRVKNFRSIKESLWIDADRLTGLVGMNESGKTNFLLPLWKLNPAKGGEINPLADYPRKDYHTIRSAEKKPVFIEAVFTIEHDLRLQLQQVSGINVTGLKQVRVAKDYSNTLHVYFDDFELDTNIHVSDVISYADVALRDVNAQVQQLVDTPSKTLQSILLALNNFITNHKALHIIEPNKVQQLINTLTVAGYENEALYTVLNQQLKKSQLSSLGGLQDVQDLIKKHMPCFVYYSNYGNLDSEIYLPHVIDNMQRDDLSNTESDKARTLKVLFDFVKLSPEEILELGTDHIEAATDESPANEKVKKTATNKREREILLQIASNELTNEFKDWWKQGNYRFRFQADGNHFRIWVADNMRPEEIELEGRSSGLQWFFSFYLVFLVESQHVHKDAILLLDEPGLSLHPMAQRDLANFFDVLSHSNQIVYSTHSPFMIDTNRLDRINAVYMNDEGYTEITSDLRQGSKQLTKEYAVKPIHAALGLNMSEVMLSGTQAVLVRSMADQHYLHILKNHLIAQGLLKPYREIVFLAVDDSSGIQAMAQLLGNSPNGAEHTELPFILLGSDAPSITLKNNLEATLYANDACRLVEVGSTLKMRDADVEDLMPGPWVADIISRLYKGPEVDFIEFYKERAPLVNQVKSWAKEHHYQLNKQWRLDLALEIKKRFYRSPPTLSGELMRKWLELFSVVGRQDVSSAKLMSTQRHQASPVSTY